MKVRTDLRSGQGMGDLIADITKVTGVDRLAQTYEEITGKSCGCKDRQERLNEIFPIPYQSLAS